jgi:hypothetical protein
MKPSNADASLEAHLKMDSAEKQILREKIANLRMGLKSQIEKNQSLREGAVLERVRGLECERAFLTAMLELERQNRSHLLQIFIKMKEEKSAAIGQSSQMRSWLQFVKRAAHGLRQRV